MRRPFTRRMGNTSHGGRKLVLKLSWKRGSKIDFSVAKDGVDVTAVGRFIVGDFYRIFVIDLPSLRNRI